MYRDYLIEQRYRARDRERGLAILVTIIILLVAVFASAVMATTPVEFKEHRHQSIVERCKSMQPRPDYCDEYLTDLAHGRRERGVIPCASDSQCAQKNPHLPIY